MLLWIGLAVFVLPLFYVLSRGSRESRVRNRELERIQRRLAEKNADSGDGGEAR